MGHLCACGHEEEKEHDKCDDCHCGHDHDSNHCTISPEDKAKLEEAIKAAGFEVKETEDGEIQIMEK